MSAHEIHDAIGLAEQPARESRSDRPAVGRDDARRAERPRRPSPERSAESRRPGGASAARNERGRFGQALARLYQRASASFDEKEPSLAAAAIDVAEESRPEIAIEPSTVEHAPLRFEPRELSERERRAFPRRESVCLVAIYEKRDDAPINQQEARWLLHSSRFKGVIADISMNGLGFLISEKIEKGTSLLMRLINRRLDRHFDTSARVVRAAPDGLGEWKIVCRFDRNLSLDQVHEFGQNVFAAELV